MYCFVWASCARKLCGRTGVTQINVINVYAILVLRCAENVIASLSPSRTNGTHPVAQRLTAASQITNAFCRRVQSARRTTPVRSAFCVRARTPAHTNTHTQNTHTMYMHAADCIGARRAHELLRGACPYVSACVAAAEAGDM